jgi:hypothetical protein
VPLLINALADVSQLPDSRITIISLQLGSIIIQVNI